MSKLTVLEVKTKAHRKAFVNFPYALYSGHKNWIPPLKQDELNAIRPQKNSAFKFCEARFWLVYKANKVVGRVGAILHHPLNKKWNEQALRFTRIDFVNDETVFKTLIKTVEHYALEKNCSKIHGPLGFSNLDHQGVLIEGFEHHASAASDYHPPYYHSFFEKQGFIKEVDWVEFRFQLPDKLPPKANRLSTLVMKKYGLKVREIKNNADLNHHSKELFLVFNNAFQHLFGTFPLPDAYIADIKSKFNQLLNTELTKFVEDEEGNLVAFAIAIPSLSAALQKANGRLFPVGWYHIKKALKHPTEMDLALTGVVQQFQSKGVVALLMKELWTSARRLGIKNVETTAMLETNKSALQMWDSFNAIQHKRKRCYFKLLET